MFNDLNKIKEICSHTTAYYEVKDVRGDELQ